MVSVLDLSKLPIFEGVSEEMLSQIVPMAEEVSAAKGEMLFCEGCDADKFYVLLEGNVTLSMKLTSSPENLVLGVIKDYGQSFGWSVIVSAKHYTATAECKEDSRLIAFRGDALFDFMRNNKDVGFDIAMRMAEIVSSRLRYYRVLMKTF